MNKQRTLNPSKVSPTNLNDLTVFVYTACYYYFTSQTLFLHQNISRQTMTDTVVFDMDTMCILKEAGVSIIPNNVFTWKINWVSSLFILNLLLPFMKILTVTSSVKKSFYICLGAVY